MGGNVFKGTRRLTKEEHLREGLFVSMVMSNRWPERRFQLVLNKSDKTSFGDIDVVMERDDLADEFLDELKELFELDDDDMAPAPGAAANKRGFIHFKYREFQVDLVLVEKVAFNLLHQTLVHEDLLMYLSVMAKKNGWKFSGHGLKVPIVKKGQYEWKTFSYDFNDGLRLLGLDEEQALNGFQNEESAFEFTSSSSKFHRELFNPSNMSRKKSKRPRLYEGRMRFLKWVDDNHVENKKDYEDFNVSGPYKAFSMGSDVIKNHPETEKWLNE